MITKILTILALLVISGVYIFSIKEWIPLRLGFSPQYGVSGGLIGYWSFDTRANRWTTSTTGSTMDLSNTSVDGTFVSMSQTATPSNGKMGQALNFDGSNDRIDVTSSTVRLTGNMTLSIWANADQFKVGAFNNTFFSYTGAATELEADNWLYYFSVDDGTHILRAFHESGAGTDNTAVSTAGATTADPNEWHHYVQVRDVTANTYTFYFDGQQLGNAVSYSSDPSGGTGGTHMRIGQHHITSTNIFDGKLDEPRIYNRALSAQEVNQLYRLGLSGHGR